MKTYLKYTILEFFNLNHDFDTLFENQTDILNKLNNLEKIDLQNQELILKEEESSYYDYVTLKNLLLLLLFLAFIGGGFWLYSTGTVNTDILDSLIKDLGDLSKELHQLDSKLILESLNKLNENTANFSKEELKLLLEIRNLLQTKGAENKSLDQPLNLVLRDGAIVWAT